MRNGLTVLIDERPTASVVIEVIVKVGSNFESRGNFGISHFVEHMLFEGTKHRTTREIANAIEGIGGEINAATSNERTFFYCYVPKKYFNKALDVLADIIQNPLFDEKTIEKERKIILDEINLVNDNHLFYQWVLFQKTLFKKNSAKNPVYGTRETIRSMSKADLLKFYKKYYVPNNILISISGGVCKGVVGKIEKAFGVFKSRNVCGLKIPKEPKQNRIEVVTEKRDVLHSYIVLGYNAAKRGEEDSYVLDVIQAVLGRGQSGRMFNEIRTKRGLAYSVGVQYEANVDFGFFAVYLSSNKKNLENIKKIILQEFTDLENLSEDELNDAKNYIEGNFILKAEENKERADLIGFWEMVGDAKKMSEYVNRIKKVTKRDIKRVAKKYFTKNYTLVMLEQN